MRFGLVNNEVAVKRIELIPTVPNPDMFDISTTTGAISVEPETGKLNICLAEAVPMFSDIGQDTDTNQILFYQWGATQIISVIKPDGSVNDIVFPADREEQMELGVMNGFWKVEPSHPYPNMYSEIWHRSDDKATDAKAPPVLTKASRGDDGLVTLEGTCPDDCVLSVNTITDDSTAFIKINPGVFTFKATFALPENFEGFIRTRFGSYGSRGSDVFNV